MPTQHQPNPTGSKATANNPTSNAASDDETVVSGHSTIRFTATDSRKELVLKLRLKSKTALTTSAIATKTFAILQAIRTSFGSDITIYPNGGKHRTLQTFEPPAKDADFEQLFTVTRHTGNKLRGITPSAWIIFRVLSPVTLSTIRNSSAVKAALSQHASSLQFYPWDEQTRDVVSIGWFLGPIPKYTLSEQFQEEIMSKLHSARPPKFRCVLENIQATDSSGVIYKCQAFGLQVERQHAVRMKHILNQNFPFNSDATEGFVFYSDRRTYPVKFAKTVHRQAELTEQYRVVAIAGLSPDHMFQFEVTIREHWPEVIKVLRTPSTNTESPTSGVPLGRYNLLCKAKHFVPLAQSLSRSLHVTYLEHLHQQELPMPPESNPIRIVSRFPSVDETSTPSDADSSLSSRQTYMTSWDAWTNEYNPATSTIPDAVWETVPDKPQATSPSISTVTSRRTYASVASSRPPTASSSPNAISQTAQIAAMSLQIATLEKNQQEMMELLRSLRAIHINEESSKSSTTTSSPKRKSRRRSPSAASSRTGRSSPMEEDSSGVDNHE